MQRLGPWTLTYLTIFTVVLIGLCGGAVTAVLASRVDRRVTGTVPLELPMRLTPRSNPNERRRISSQVPWVEVLSRRRGAFLLLRLRRAYHFSKNTARRVSLRLASLDPRRRNRSPGDRRWFQDTIGDDASVSMLEAMTVGLERGVSMCCVFADTEQPRLFHEILPGLESRVPGSRTLIESHVIRGADHEDVRAAPHRVHQRAQNVAPAAGVVGVLVGVRAQVEVLDGLAGGEVARDDQVARLRLEVHFTVRDDGRLDALRGQRVADRSDLRLCALGGDDRAVPGAQPQAVAQRARRLDGLRRE